MGSKVRKLVLHVDVNNTIFVGDSKTKLTILEGVLNEYITEIVWGNVNIDGCWTPTDHNPISTTPSSPEAVSYYKYAEERFEQEGKPREQFKEHVRRFTFEEVGRRFRSHLEKVKEKLEYKGDFEDPRLESLVMREEQGLFYRVIPAFFKLLDHLLVTERDFSIILRTFGGDGGIALKATQLYTQNLHPDFHFPSTKQLKVSTKHGKIVPSEEGLCVINGDSTIMCANNIYQAFSKSSGVQLYVDSYDWWKKNGFSSSAGKPLLIDPSDATVHHIIFDDNIRPWEPMDNIVHLLVKDQDQFVDKDCSEFDGLCLLRSNLFESIINEDYFIEKVKMCEQNYDEYLSKAH